MSRFKTRIKLFWYRITGAESAILTGWLKDCQAKCNEAESHNEFLSGEITRISESCKRQMVALEELRKECKLQKTYIDSIDAARGFSLNDKPVSKKQVLAILRTTLHNADLSTDICDSRYIERIEAL